MFNNSEPLPDIVHLRHKMGKMSDRIRQLEDSLEVLQRERSNRPHPLLQKELLDIKFLDNATDVQGSSEHSNDVDELDDTFGTLAISESGVSQFVGRSGGTEVSYICAL